MCGIQSVVEACLMSFKSTHLLTDASDAACFVQSLCLVWHSEISPGNGVWLQTPEALSETAAFVELVLPCCRVWALLSLANIG